MNTTKREKTLKILKTTKRVFDECWREVPEHMTRKLNAGELAEYMGRHVLPVITKRMLSNPYLQSKVTKRLIGVA
ncbi:hypothetical protein [Leptospira weilii]|uniref:Uncharacterized protein n=1 Tax=Leptospira weilii str. UI 13098 TaxID=1088542 RepID=M6QFQ3_9LEPT|nr:hypothetical protein [Leptospira weilii]EMN91323.1 hypothetical protein LEP1GSC108_3289 [Leptospira weilii str. UI 13098]